MNKVFHWTDFESVQAIIDSSQWDGGSATTNPRYRFEKGIPGETAFALMFDGKDFVKRKDPTVPWKEWEWTHEESIELFDEKFLGFVTRTKRSKQKLTRLLVETYGDKYMFPVKLLREVQ